MSGPASWKKILCFTFIAITLCAHYYIVSNTETAAYVKGKITNFTSPLIWSNPNRRSDKSHVILLSYARTGSSFVGDLLQSHPDTFYHFEPVHFISSSVLNSSFSVARNLMNKLFTCNITRLPTFLAWQKKHVTYMKFKRSIKFWKSCTVRKTCYNASFIDKFCSKHRVVIIKTIRLPLREAAHMFTEYPDLNLKIVYLVRDPRGTLNSRHKFPVIQWCRKDPVCFKARTFCNTVDQDLKTSCKLMSERPGDFLMIRYEDLSQDPHGVSKQLMNFLGLPEDTKEVNDFIKSHTSVSGSVDDRRRLDGLEFSYATFRNSTETAFRWRREITYTETLGMQRDCKNVLIKLGYHVYTTSGALMSNINFNRPLQDSLKNTCSAKG